MEKDDDKLILLVLIALKNELFPRGENEWLNNIYIYIYGFGCGLNFYKFHEFRRITRKLFTKCYKFQVETKNTTKIILK